MKKKLFTGLAMILFEVSIVGTANATIIDINSKTNTWSNPVAQYFDAGTYDVIPIGVIDGGAYNAWSAWGSSTRWVNQYSLSSDEFSAYTPHDGTVYATSLLALDNAISTSFTLTSGGSVNFFIADSLYSDNVGGISLNVELATPTGNPTDPVPEPATMLLFGTGIAGLAGSRLRRKKK